MKYAIVTGSTKGIGKSIAEKLLANNFFVFVNYSFDDKAASIFEKENDIYKNKFQIIKQDLSTFENVREFISKILLITNIIDVVILNASITDRSSFGEITSAQWENVLNVNLNSPFYLVQGLKNYISTNGRIIFIGAIMGEYSHAISLSYAVSKAAIHQLSNNLVKEFADKKITVNVIAPGFVDTPWQNTKTEEHKKRIKDKIALKRFATSEEIADLCYAVINNSYINGSVINIDGGYDYK